MCNCEFAADYRLKDNKLLHADLMLAKKYIRYERVGAPVNLSAAAASNRAKLQDSVVSNDSNVSLQSVRSFNHHHINSFYSELSTKRDELYVFVL